MKNMYVYNRALRSVKDKEFIKDIYDLDDTAFELWKTAKLNTNIIWDDWKEAEIGYKAYWELEQYIKKHNMIDDVLFDLAADFKWDKGLENACKRFDKEFGIKPYVEFRGTLFDPNDGWTRIYDDVIFDMPEGNAINLVKQLEDTYGNYPNVKKACEVFYNKTYRTEPYDYRIYKGNNQ